MRPDDVELVESRSVLTKASGYLRGYSHTLNPYIGCAFGENGCGVYCYVAESPIARYAGKPWGQWVKAKVNAADALRRDLDRAGSAHALRVFMSSATDPYQPAERELRVTRSILEALVERPIGLLVVQTRSPLVERDFDLLARMAFAWLSMTVETNDDAVRRALTPTCASIERRLATMREARERGVRVQAAVSPALPHDHEAFVDLLVGHADRVVVDTFSGDGADGRRTKRRPLPSRFAELGFGDWEDTSEAERLHAALVTRMGHRHTGWSVEGFNDLAAEPAAAARQSTNAMLSAL